MWDYLPGSHLKSRLTYPNGATAAWEYEPKRDLLARVTNTINGIVASQYTYTNDLLGRRTGIGKSGSMMAADETQPYGYNVRDELISGQNQTYAYDDIGNRTTAEGKTYAANNLNQYTAIDDFVPEYDADGNQTLIKTETGVWSVVYNAENRPVRWQSGDTVITMAFDRMGRRVEMRTVKDGEETFQCFVYDNYLCIQQLRGADNALFHSYVWDPTEPIATRPLVFLPASGEIAYYFHDGNKNVSDLVDIHGSVVHYDYTPFGTIIASIAAENNVSEKESFQGNPFRYSSEMFDDKPHLTYYNYRHYSRISGRWLARERIQDANSDFNLYLFSANSPMVNYDFHGDVAICAPLIVWATPTVTAWVSAGAVTVATITASYIVDVYNRTRTQNYTETVYEERCGECTESATTRKSITVVETRRIPRGKNPCRPCFPPEGTFVFGRYDATGAKHKGVLTPHSHYRIMRQRLTDCRCFWNDADTLPASGPHPIFGRKNPAAYTPPELNGGGFW